MIKVSEIARGKLESPVFDRPELEVSDLHLNCPGGQDNFGPNSRMFCEFLDLHSPEIWGLTLNGDINDIWECNDRAAIIRHNWEVERRIIRYPSRKKLLGNHDGEPGAPESEFVDETPLRHIWHGHQLDPACSGPGYVGKIASAIWAMIERDGLADELAWLRDAALGINRRLYPTAAERGADNAIWIADAAKRGKVYCSSAHTHHAQLVEIAPGRWYGNPGSWVNPGRGEAIEIDGRDIRLLEITMKEEK